MVGMVFQRSFLNFVLTNLRCYCLDTFLRALMIDHFNLPVTDLLSTRQFYEAALTALGYSVIVEGSDYVGFGKETWVFGLVLTSKPIPPLRFAFVAGNHETVNNFFEFAIKAGGKANGDPGFRPEYDSNYYAAYVIDPEGHNIEAVSQW